MSPKDKVVRIGGASGAWGDSPLGLEQLMGEDIGYVMMDYLAEVTMSLLARARAKDAAAGFAPDFISYLLPHLAEMGRRRIRVVSNAGGVNPQACKRALQAACAKQGVSLKVAVVEGDDLMPLMESLRAENLREWSTGEPLPPRLLTANAYLGALPIARALAEGADIVVTGRCADSALALGILMHEFGWQADQHDLLASGSLVGHLLECGPQATGGIFTDWQNVPDWHNIGYPVAHCRPDGRFSITKPAGTGGLVTVATVAEQLLYEVGDPAAYVLPDVVADFSQVRLVQAGPEKVDVSGARGGPAPTQYKVSATWQDGHRAVALIAIVGVDAERKARRSAQALLERAQMRFTARGLPPFSATHIEVLGAESAYGDQSRALASREVVLRLVVQHEQPACLELFARELGSAGLSFAQGTAALIGGRPKATPVIRLFSFLIDKARLPPPRVQLDEGPALDIALPAGLALQHATPPSLALAPGAPTADPRDEPLRELSLMELAHARSGDKGNTSNIAIICRRPEYMAHLREVLTPERLALHFAGTVHGQVRRYEVPGVHAFNFVLEDALGGGGMASMRLDSQGKAFGQRALEMRVPAPPSWPLA